MSELYELPEGWEWKKLDDFTTIKSGKRVPKGCKLSDEKTPYPYIRVTDFSDNESIDTSDIKYITEEIYLKIKNYTITDNDIYISVAGTIGKTGIIPSELNGANLTENAVKIVFDNEAYDKRYLLNFTNSITFMEQVGLATKTVAMPKLAIKRLKEVNIPLPPLQEQKRIVAKLDALFEKIDQAIALHQQNIDEAEAFMGSVLNEVFGELEERYAKVPLFDVADVARGKSKHRPRNDKKLFGGEYPFIQTGDVRNANRYISSHSNTYSEFGLKQSKLWNKGTICMTIAANIGDVAVLDMDSCFPDSVVGIYSEKNSNEYLYFFLLTLKQQLESKATTTAQMNINLKVLQTIGVPLPSIIIQQKTVIYLDQLSTKTEQVKALQAQKMQSLKDLKASILDRAFRGEM